MARATPPAPAKHHLPGFRHEAFFYSDDAEYMTGAAAFIDEALAAGDPVLVMVPGDRRELLHDRFGGVAPGLLQFAPMERTGHNPAWIIPAWADYVAPHLAAGRRARGIGEPIWASRTGDQLVECGRHESLINLAFAQAGGFSLLCPYDTASLDDHVIRGAHRNHPHLRWCQTHRPSDNYEGQIPASIEVPLEPAPAHATSWSFSTSDLSRLRRRVAALATEAGLAGTRVDDLVLAVSEALSNSIRHGGGAGQLAVWHTARHIVCEVRDHGRIVDPLAGRVRPSADELGGRGLWLINQLCDLVQLRPVGSGQALRFHVDLPTG